MKKLWMTNGTYDYLAELQKESDEIIIAQDEDQYLAVLENSVSSGRLILFNWHLQVSSQVLTY